MTVDQRIGRFRLERALGSGAFSTVWLAHDESLDDPVALKILADNWSHSDDARMRFVEEARALRSLDGDRIVRVYELAYLAGGRPYMVMEFADRGSLEERMRFAKQAERPFSASEVAALGIELAGCLASVHAGRFVHRDVKPSNILFRTVPPEAQDAMRRTGRPAPTERMLLGDFGIARRMELAGLTQVVGSPQYMAPEQADPQTAHRVDARADVYSAGVVLFELLAGHPPGRPPDHQGLIDRGSVTNDPFGAQIPARDGIADVRSFRSDVPPTMANAIRTATARDPEDRYASAWELRQDLVRSLGEPASVVTAPYRPVAAPPAPVPAIRPPRPVASAGVAVAATHALEPGTRTDVIADARIARSAERAPVPTATSMASPGPAPATRLGTFDTCVWSAAAGAILVVAALLQWRSPSGAGMVTGIDMRAGTVVFAAGGALVLASVLRWAIQGRWGLRLARLLADLGWIAAFGAVLAEIASSHGAIGAILGHGIHARLGTGVFLALVGAVFAFVAAGRAKRQLRELNARRLAPRGDLGGGSFDGAARSASGPPSAPASAGGQRSG